MSRKRPIFISISIVKTISINVSDNDYRILTEIAKDQRRRLADFSYLLYARGLTFFFCETPVCISKIESDYTEADRLQQKINADLEKTEGWRDLEWKERKEKGYVHIGTCISDDDLIDPLVERIEACALDPVEEEEEV